MKHKNEEKQSGVDGNDDGDGDDEKQRRCRSSIDGRIDRRIRQRINQLNRRQLECDETVTTATATVTVTKQLIQDHTADILSENDRTPKPDGI